jgi:hypothetical protein
VVEAVTEKGLRFFGDQARFISQQTREYLASGPDRAAQLGGCSLLPGEREIEVSDLDSIHSFINRKMMDEITPRE